MAGGGNTQNTGLQQALGQRAWHDPLQQSRADVYQQQMIERQMMTQYTATRAGTTVHVSGNGGAGYVSLTVGGGGGGSIQNAIQPIGGGTYIYGGGGGASNYAATGSFGTTTTSSYWGGDAKPIFDPRWYNTYLEARDAAVMERLSGE